MRTFLALLVLVLLLLAGGVYLVQEDEKASVRTSLAVAEALAGDTTGYRRVLAPRDFVFPEDHGPHPGFKTEWWYATGNLATPAGRRFGYQFTLFRTALAPPDSTASDGTASAWTTRQLYMGHFALTDVADAQFYAFERFSRAAAGLAGAQAAPFRVWLEDWSLAQAGGGGVPPLRLRAAQDGVALDLTLAATRPLILQGNRGFDRKGPGVGNASHYYSFTRLATAGTVTLGDATMPVSGLSWLDREWSTSVLADGQVGWDWFALHLDDGRDLMFYQIREADGGASRFSHGVVVAPDGTAQRFDADAATLTVADTWDSPRGGTYPAAWRLQVPAHGLDLRLAPLLADQELDVSIRYWEGAVAVGGSHSGHGYVELTGYGETPAARGAVTEATR